MMIAIALFTGAGILMAIVGGGILAIAALKWRAAPGTPGTPGRTGTVWLNQANLKKFGLPVLLVVAGNLLAWLVLGGILTDHPKVWLTANLTVSALVLAGLIPMGRTARFVAILVISGFAFFGIVGPVSKPFRLEAEAARAAEVAIEKPIVIRTGFGQAKVTAPANDWSVPVVMDRDGIQYHFDGGDKHLLVKDGIGQMYETKDGSYIELGRNRAAISERTFKFKSLEGSPVEVLIFWTS